MKIITIASSSKGCCYVVEIGDSAIMFEAGVSLKSIRKIYHEVSKIGFCLVSHEHGDHSNFVSDILENTDIKIYTNNALKKQFDSKRICEVKNKKFFNLTATEQCVPIILNHDFNVDCFGFLVWSDKTGEKIFYATDTSNVPYNFPALTHLMIEANYQIDLISKSDRFQAVIQRTLKTHMSIEQTLDFIKRHKELREIHLIHLSEAHSDKDSFIRMAQDISGCPVYC